MFTLFDHAFAILLVALFPIWGSTIGYRRLQRANPAERPRLRLMQYRRAIGVQWLLASALLLSWILQRRSWSAAPAGIGLMPLLTFGLGGVALGTIVVVIYVIRVRGRILDDPEGLAEVRERLDHVQPMMPRTPREFRWFFGLSITAGICEELLYRGYLIWYFTHFLGLIPAAVVASVVFGIGHSYQGRRGVLMTAGAGAFLSAVYLLSGSLVMPMLLHALMDLHSGHLGYVAFERFDVEQARARAEQAEVERLAMAEEDERRRMAQQASPDAGGAGHSRAGDTPNDFNPTEGDDAAGA